MAGKALRRFAPWIVAALLVLAAAWSMAPPAPLAADAPETDFSAARAIRHVAVVAAQPHPLGSQQIAEVRNYLVQQLEALDIVVELQRTTTRDPYGTAGTVDVVATIPGSAPSQPIALMAHYDTFTVTPGANDNSSAVAALLETARALTAGTQLNEDIILLFTDAEEPAGRAGANLFLRQHPRAAEIGFFANFEALGGSGPSLLVETNGPTGWVVGEYAAGVSRPVGYSFSAEITKLIGEVGTDFDPFRAAGIPGLHVAYTRGSSIYHTPADDLASVSWASLQHHGETALGMVRQLDATGLATTREDDAVVYFSLRPWLVRYPASWSLPLAVLALVLLGAAVRRAGIAVGELVRRTARYLAGVLVATLTSTVLWVAVAAVDQSPGALQGYLYLSVHLVGATYILRWVAGSVFGRRGMLAAVAVWTVLALATAPTMPGISYLFVWPALIGAIVALWSGADDPRWQMLRYTVVAATTLLLLSPAVDFFFQTGQPRPGNPDSSIPATAGVSFLLGALAIGLMRSWWPEPDTADL